jgi:hypothetical protein
MSRVTNYERYIESLIGEKIAQETIIRVEQRIKAQTKLMMITMQLNEKFGQAGADFAAELKGTQDQAFLDHVLRAFASVNSLDELKRIVAVNG